jgi:ubiquinone/menaquinone biosynthesis C-methylase UbiE
MSTKITINSNLIEAAEAVLKQVGVIDEAVSVEADGMTLVLSPKFKDVLFVSHTIRHAEIDYYLGLPLD